MFLYFPAKSHIKHKKSVGYAEQGNQVSPEITCLPNGILTPYG